MKLLNIKPLIKPVDLNEAATISVWPDRIRNNVPWQRGERTTDDVLREYDAEKFKGLLEKWEEFEINLSPSQHNPAAALRFYEFFSTNYRLSTSANQSVYGKVLLDSYLVSISDQLYATEIGLFLKYYRGYIVDRIINIWVENPFDTLVEIGCGEGQNLLNAYIYLNLACICGVDLSNNAIGFLNRMTADLKINSQFCAGNISDTGDIKSIVPENSRWAMLSAASVMILPETRIDWFREIVSYPNPPEIGIHFEPLLWDDGTEFSQLCAKYIELNRYNQDFLQTLLRAEKEGIIEITHIEKNVLGATAFCPASFVVWKPKKK